MKNTMVVVADLSCFKAYRLENHQPNQTPRLEPMEEFNSADAHTKLVDKVTDLAGRFPRRTGAQHTTGAMSDGERHNIELESRKRMVRQLAQRLNALARPKEVSLALNFMADSRPKKAAALTRSERGYRVSEESGPCALVSTATASPLTAAAQGSELRLSGTLPPHASVSSSGVAPPNGVLPATIS